MILNPVLKSPLSDPLLGSLGDFLPSQLAGLKVWNRYNKGITEAGTGVSQWDDASGNGNHLLQGTDGSRPSKESDGSILFNGSSDFLKANAFTLVQPETIFLLVKQITYLSGDWMTDGNLVSSGLLYQNGISPNTSLYAGTELPSVAPVLGTYNILTGVFNGASSVLQLNADTPVTGNAGTRDMGGFILGAINDGSSRWAHIQVKEVAVFSSAIDSVGIAKMVAYLQSL